MWHMVWYGEFLDNIVNSRDAQVSHKTRFTQFSEKFHQLSISYLTFCSRMPLATRLAVSAT